METWWAQVRLKHVSIASNALDDDRLLRLYYT